MANSAPSVVQIWYDDSGGTPVDITSHVLTCNGIPIEELTEEVGPFGRSWNVNKGIGVGQVPDMTFGGLYEDTVLDPLFANRIPEGPNATTRTLKIVYIPGSPEKATSLETILKKYDRPLDRSALGKYEVTLQHAGGAVTET